MDVQAIALPHGATLVWIRVGSRLDPLFAHRPDEIVTRIVNTGMGFRIETSGSDTRGVTHYETCSQFVSRVHGLDIPYRTLNAPCQTDSNGRPDDPKA